MVVLVDREDDKIGVKNILLDASLKVVEYGLFLKDLLGNVSVDNEGLALVESLKIL